MKFTPEMTTKWVEEQFALQGLTQAEFCRKYGFNEADISRYKRHHVRFMADLMDRLVEAFNVDYEILWMAFGIVDTEDVRIHKIADDMKNSKAIWLINKK